MPNQPITGARLRHGAKAPHYHFWRVVLDADGLASHAIRDPRPYVSRVGAYRASLTDKQRATTTFVRQCDGWCDFHPDQPPAEA